MSKRKQQPKITKKEIIELVIVLVLLLVIYLINRPNIIRLFLWFIILAIACKNIFVFFKQTSKHKILYVFLVFFLSIIIDGIITVTFKRVPVFTYNILTIENVKVYTSPGLRVWQCDKSRYKNLIVQPFFEKGYLCNAENVATIESNSFLNSIVENYEEYRNTYVKIKGPISKKNGQNTIEMRPYEQSDITINGYVEFQDTITLRVVFEENNNELDNYDIYDEIIVLGQIKNLEQENGKYVVYMAGAKVLSTINLNEYTISVNSRENCDTPPEALVVTNENDVYSYCINEITVSYPDNKYELADALSSSKINIEELYSGAFEEKKNESDDTKLYILGNYNVVVCDASKSRDVIVGSPDLSLDKVTCTPKVEG